MGVPSVTLAVVVTAVVAVATGLARRTFEVVEVVGTSMQPALEPGDRVLVRRWPRPVRSGQLVVFPTPVAGAAERLLVKRVAAVAGEPVPAEVEAAVGPHRTVPLGQLLVRGDAERSQDSRSFGFLPTAAVRGVVVRSLS